MILKLINLILLLAATAWLTTSHEWEPLIAFITLFSGIVIQEYKDNSLGNKGELLEHDKKLFIKYDNILPEKDFIYLLNNDLWNLRTKNSYVNQIGQYLHIANAIEGNFVEQKIKQKFDKFIACLSELKTFLATHFFVPKEKMTKNSEGDLLLYLYPDLKYSDDNEKRELYKEREKQLHELIDKTVEYYTNFRKQIKKEIYI